MGFDGNWMAIEEIVADILDRRGVTPTKLGGEFTDSGHRVISAKLMKGGRLDLNADEPRFVEQHVYEKWMRTPLHRGDVLMTSEAPLGELAYMAEGADWCLGQRLFALRPNPDRVDGRFLFYALQTAEVRADINGRASGTTVLGIRQAELRKVQVPVPHLEQQTSVAEFLGAIDDRIDLLRQTNTTLEAIAQSLFKSWFVDFDPVHAKAEGREPEAMDAATATLFPSEFEESELGLIPRGWCTPNISSSLAAIETGRRPKGGVSGFSDGIPSVGAESINGIGVFDFAKTKFVPPEFFSSMKKGIPRGGEVLLYKDGGKPGEFKPRLAMFGGGFPFKQYALNEHVFMLRANETLPSNAFLYFWLSQERQLNILRHAGNKAAIPGINRGDVERVPILVPSTGVVSAFDAIASALIKRMLIAANQMKSLSDLRDTLLPRLISGKLRLPDAVHAAEEALA